MQAAVNCPELVRPRGDLSWGECLSRPGVSQRHGEGANDDSRPHPSHPMPSDKLIKHLFPVAEHGIQTSWKCCRLLDASVPC